MAIPTTITTTINISTNVAGHYAGGGTNYNVQLPNGTIYKIFIDELSDPVFKKSLDGGMTWGTKTVLKNMNSTALSVWYDRWSGIDADLIHVVYADSSSDDVFYRNINAASSDTLSTEYTVFAGTDTANGGALSIARMRGGNLIVVGSIDAATEIFSRKSTDVGVNWSDIAAGYEASGTGDFCIVMPGWGVDNQDAMMFYYDRSATEISVKYYDDSANSWSETSIATSISLPDYTSGTFGHMAATVDITNSQNLIVFWTAIDAANADLRCFKVTQSAQTETGSNVVLNSTDDQGFCGISINSNNNYWYVFYTGNSEGTEIYNSAMNIYYKISGDSGANWGSETLLTNDANSFATFNVLPIYYTVFGVSTNYIGIYKYTAPLAIPHTNYQIGI